MLPLGSETLTLRDERSIIFTGRTCTSLWRARRSCDAVLPGDPAGEVCVVVCPQCETSNPKGARFCLSCGLFLRVAGPLHERRGETKATGSDQPRHEAPAQEGSLLERALTATDEGDLLGAIVLCRQATAQDPANSAAFSLLGVLYERLGEKDRAIEAYERALELNPGSTADREKLALLKGEQRQRPDDEITQTFWPTEEPLPVWKQRPVQIAAAAAAGFVLFVVLIGWAVHSRAARANAQTAQTQAVEMIKRGDAHFAQGHYNEARRAYEDALRLDPANAQAQRRLAQMQNWTPPTTGYQTATPLNQRPPLLPPRRTPMFAWNMETPMPAVAPSAWQTVPIQRSPRAASTPSPTTRSQASPPPIVSDGDLPDATEIGPVGPSGSQPPAPVAPVPGAPYGAVTPVIPGASDAGSSAAPREPVIEVQVVERPERASPPAGNAVEPVASPPQPRVQRPSVSPGDQQLDRARSLRAQGRYAEAAAAAQAALNAFQGAAAQGDIRARNGAGMARALKELCEREQQRASTGSGG
jgi:tetratricopeptide (TPR) repeat protein